LGVPKILFFVVGGPISALATLFTGLSLHFAWWIIDVGAFGKDRDEVEGTGADDDILALYTMECSQSCGVLASMCVFAITTDESDLTKLARFNRLPTLTGATQLKVALSKDGEHISLRQVYS